MSLVIDRENVFKPLLRNDSVDNLVYMSARVAHFGWE